MGVILFLPLIRSGRARRGPSQAVAARSGGKENICAFGAANVGASLSPSCQLEVLFMVAAGEGGGEKKKEKVKKTLCGVRLALHSAAALKLYDNTDGEGFKKM